MRPHHYTILGVIVGVIIILIALRVFSAAAREAGEGSCLTGCCLFELGESLLDLGCGLIGCGGVLACGMLAVGVVHLSHMMHLAR